MSDVLALLTDVVDALTQPTQERTPMHTWSQDRSDRNKKRLPDHVTYVPSLLVQLAAQAFPLTVDGDQGAGARSVPQSKLPGNAEALATYLDIHASVIRWTRRFEITRRDTLTSTVRKLLAHTPKCPGYATDLLSDSMGWLESCQRVAGLIVPDPTLTVPCPVCHTRAMRVDLDDHVVRCVACGDRWVQNPEPDAVGVGALADLATYVTRYRTKAESEADAVRAEWRRRKAANTYRWTDETV